MPLEVAVAKLGLRDSFVKALAKTNITSCYQWQAAALREVQPPGSNFVYCAPTSGGKSHVADVLMLLSIQNRVTDWKKPAAKALVLVPYLSIGALPCGKHLCKCTRRQQQAHLCAADCSNCGEPYAMHVAASTTTPFRSAPCITARAKTLVQWQREALT